MTDRIKIPLEDDSDRVVAWVEGTRAEIDAALDEMLGKVKRWKNPARRAAAERRVLRAMSLLNRAHEPEHGTLVARRHAGGGSLTKGS